MTKKELADAKAGYIRGYIRVCQMIKRGSFKSASAFYNGMRFVTPLSVKDKWEIEEDILARYNITEKEFIERIREREY